MPHRPSNESKPPEPRDLSSMQRFIGLMRQLSNGENTQDYYDELRAALLTALRDDFKRAAREGGGGGGGGSGGGAGSSSFATLNAAQYLISNNPQVYSIGQGAEVMHFLAALVPALAEEHLLVRRRMRSHL